MFIILRNYKTYRLETRNWLHKLWYIARMRYLTAGKSNSVFGNSVSYNVSSWVEGTNALMDFGVPWK